MQKPSTYGAPLLLALAVWGSQVQAASVLGRAVRKDGSNPEGMCHATLSPELDRHGAPDPDFGNSPDGPLSSLFNQNGEFQFPRVPPANYVLAVECPRASAVREVRVQSGVMRLAPPLLLEDLTFNIAITPSLDPLGQPWQLTVDATMPRLRSIASKAATNNGHWTRHGLVAGNYRVNISSSDGTPRLQRFFNLSASSGPLSVQLPFIQVEGIVRLSAQPLRASLVFHNDAGGEPATLTSDENGSFQGLLPATPGVEKTTWTIEARSVDPPISRRLTGVTANTGSETSVWLDLALPAFAVHGIVVSQTGEPQSGVQVIFEETASGTQSSTDSGEAGGFQLQDLLPGKYTVVAESLEGVSERTAFVVAEGTEGELKLVLDPSERVHFQVVSGQAPICDAAVQVWIAPGAPHWFTRSDAAGHFEVKLPRGTKEVGLTVAAQGYALKLTRVQISHDDDGAPRSNTIALDTSGGSVALDLQPSGHLADSSAIPYLVHKGAIEAVGTLIELSAHPPTANHGPHIIETIEPGDYSLCLVSDPAELAALWAGAPSPKHCRTGSVQQGETVTLSTLLPN